MPRNKGVAQRKKRNGEPAGERSAPAPKRVKVPILDAYGVGTLVCKEFKPHGMFTGKVTEKWIEQRNHRPIFRVEYADGDTEDLSLAKLKQVAVQALPPPAVPDLGSPPRERKPRVGARISPQQQEAVAARADGQAAKVARADGAKTYSDYSFLLDKKTFDESTRTWICRTWVDLGCPEPEEWHDRGGTISTIQKTLHLAQGSSRTIHNVLEDAQYCLLTGHNFDPTTKDGSGGANKLVKHGSKTEHLIAKYMEGGYGVKQTTVHVNAWRKANTTLGPLGVSAVYSAHKRLDPEMTRVKSRKQGSYDAESKWAKARYHWVSQLMIRLSEWKPDLAELKAAKLVKDDAASIPACFDFAKLTPLSINQIAFWDETHRKCNLGDVGGHGILYRYPRNEEGQLDLENGTYAEEKAQVKAKYENECRLCIGVAAVDDSSGVRLEAFDYTGKKIVTRKVYEKARESAMKAVQQGGKSHHWCPSAREAGKVYTDDPMSVLTGIGSKGAQPKWQSCDIGTIGELLEADDKAREDDGYFVELLGELKEQGIGKNTKKSVVGWSEAVAEARQRFGGELQQNDYRTEENPFQARADVEGGDWEKDLDNHKDTKGLVCIEDMITHMMVETAKAYKGTAFEKTWVIYHDALSLMTAKETMKWMKTQKLTGYDTNFLDHWILPQQDLNKGTKYSYRPPGNSPELMPMDAYLNRDVHECVSRHVNVMRGMCDTLKVTFRGQQIRRRFCSSCPVRLREAYLRVWDPQLEHPAENGCPSSARIVQDVMRFLNALNSIFKHEGAVVHGKYLRNGDRKLPKGEGHGGNRTKNIEEDAEKWLHKDAEGCIATFNDEALADFVE